MIPLNWKLRLLPSHLGLLNPLNQQANKGVTLLAGVVDLDYQGEVVLLLYKGGKEKYVLSIGELLGHLLVLTCPMIKVNGKSQH